MERRREGESSSLAQREIKKARRLSNESVGQSWESPQETMINRLKQSFPNIEICDSAENCVRVVSSNEKKGCDIHHIDIDKGTINNTISELYGVNGWSYADRAFGYLLLALKEKKKTLAEFTFTDVDHFCVSDSVAHERITTLLGDNVELTFKADSEEFKTLVDTEPYQVTSELVALYSREAGRNMKITSITPYKYSSDGSQLNFSCQIAEQNN